MRERKTPMILRPVVVCMFLAAALIVCSMAFRASERAEVTRDSGSEMARLQESRAYYEGRISKDVPKVEEGEIALPALPDIPAEMKVEPQTLIVPDYAEIIPPVADPLWKKNAAAYVPDSTKAKVVIIIDDMGMDRVHTKEAMALSGPLTFSWLPYAADIQPLVDQSRAAGHEALVHVPMEPESTTVDAGPTVLKTTMTNAELETMLDKNFSAFTGYVGFNNHMGSKMTQDAAAMQLVMADAAKRGMLFIDSRTAPNSIADQTAAAMGMAHGSRDVFLDHYEDIHSVRAALERMEVVAKHQGYAIGIGHPKMNTLAALREWLPTLEAKDIQVVPVSAVVKTSEPAAGSQALSPRGEGGAPSGAEGEGDDNSSYPSALVLSPSPQPSPQGEREF